MIFHGNWVDSLCEERYVWLLWPPFMSTNANRADFSARAVNHRKRLKKANLSLCHSFVHFAVETLGPGEAARETPQEDQFASYQALSD